MHADLLLVGDRSVGDSSLIACPILFNATCQTGEALVCDKIVVVRIFNLKCESSWASNDVGNRYCYMQANWSANILVSEQDRG